MSNNNTASRKRLFTHYAGFNLLEIPLLNKGTAFSEKERWDFNLTGLLPPRFESIEEQARRAYMQYSTFSDALNKHIYLRAIQDKNETLFYALLNQHLEEMMPIIYTPTVGAACEKFSDIYRHNRGLFLAYRDKDRLDEVLRNAPKRNVKVIVITDGERILGLGDQGIGGMGIPIGKLSLYTACGGISPAYTLPITLDVGTNNQKLLDDPFYMGNRHERIDQASYDEFVDLAMKAIAKRWPDALIQFEDFAQPNAMPLLKRYRESYRCFNDDIQGTASVALGTLIAACYRKQEILQNQRVVITGAGSAGCGIAEQIISYMIAGGLSEEEARSRIYMVDRFGLVTTQTPDLREFQIPLARSEESLADWNYSGNFPTLLDVIHCAEPTILIGVSGQPNLFTEQVVHAMSAVNERPVIFPLSNPVSQVEATPEDVLNWSEGKAIIATGSPFSPVEYDGVKHKISQCNNAYIFPGIGLAVVSAQIEKITDEMLLTAADTLAEWSTKTITDPSSLLPPLTELQALSKEMAFNVGKVAQLQNLCAPMADEELRAAIEANFWKPEYREYLRTTP